MPENVTSIGSNVTISVSELRPRLKTLLINSGAIVQKGGQYSFDGEVLGTMPGMNMSTTYQTEDQAVDAIFRAWFPHLFRAAA